MSRETTPHVPPTIQTKVVSLKYTPSYNIAPTSEGVIVYLRQADTDDFKYCIEPLSFGLLPEWAKKSDSLPVKRGDQTGPEYSREIHRHQAKYFNCRKETLSHEKSVWAAPLKQRRCVVPIQGYFEWLDTRHGKTPYYVYLKKNRLLYLAGLFSHNTNYKGTEMVDGLEYFSSFSIVTGPGQGEGSNDLLWLHTRKPLFIEPNSKAWFEWLGKEVVDESTLIDDCLKATANLVYNELTWHTVSKLVGNPLNKCVNVIQEEKAKQASITQFFAPKVRKNDKKRDFAQHHDIHEQKEAKANTKSPSKKVKTEVVGSDALLYGGSEHGTGDSQDRCKTETRRLGDQEI